MKQPKKLTRKQKELASKNRLNPVNWMLVVEDDEVIILQNKSTRKLRTLSKG